VTAGRRPWKPARLRLRPILMDVARLHFSEWCHWFGATGAGAEPPADSSVPRCFAGMIGVTGRSELIFTPAFYVICRLARCPRAEKATTGVVCDVGTRPNEAVSVRLRAGNVSKRHRALSALLHGGSAMRHKRHESANRRRRTRLLVIFWDAAQQAQIPRRNYRRLAGDPQRH